MSAAMPLTADEVARGRTSYDWLAGFAGGLHWVESSPKSGKVVVASWRPSSGSRTRVSDLPADSVGSRLHAYGGMPYGWLPSYGMVMVNASTGQLHGTTGLPATAHSYGDLASSGDELLCVREDDDGDELVAIEPATGTCRVLRATDGFLASPTPGRDRLAWVQWDRDVMPWDSSEVWVADRTAYGSISRPLRVAGGPGESAVQPRWGEDGRLYFLSDRSGWWNLYRWSAGGTEALAPMDADCARAPWESTYADYVLLPENRIGMVVQRGPSHHLVVVEPDGEVVRIELPYTSIKPYLAALGSRIALIGSSPTRAQEVALVETDGSDKIEIIRAGTDRADLAAVLSIPEVMRFSSAGTEVTGLFIRLRAVAPPRR
ncbi:hypothetical protein [Micromonospora sp. NBC_01796]|uniref:hypothetical protein n=1 Tax=Micromonospora sp. NBC_01796 TaxID=2975987 RepID=UPI002DDBFBDD|nr:hypothetical protein [Micromonospora sp. NBC_01796]WSA85578.1 hypothetical protein OIE47_35395 [Micromonospora sp. NBC_01796]